jgi:two-component system cell cycle response regulator
MASILLIEDSDGQRAEIRAALESSGLCERILEARDGIQGLKMLLSESLDLVLCDLEMPGLDGEKLLHMKNASGSEVPFLVLTAVTDIERRARLLRKGASDSITKPFHTADLIARIDLHLRLEKAKNQLVEKNRLLEHLSTTDSLTGLRNRRHLDEVLNAEFARSQRHGTSMAVAMADIDNFKQINDQYGHPAGDEVLRRIADTMQDIVRVTDCGARYGGEEFLVVLMNNDSEGGLVFAERLRSAVEALRIDVRGDEPLQVTISIGVASYQPDQQSAEALITAADEALYQAKTGGRNQVVATP